MWSQLLICKKASFRYATAGRTYNLAILDKALKNFYTLVPTLWNQAGPSIPLLAHLKLVQTVPFDFEAEKWGHSPFHSGYIAQAYLSQNGNQGVHLLMRSKELVM
jgi:hypothetical protein